MKDPAVLARINLRAILRALEQLAYLDPQSRQTLNHAPLTIAFAAARLTTVRLRLGEGQATYHPGPGPSDIKLAFATPGQVNAMFAGRGNPIPLKGFRQLKYLTGPFTELTNRLESYLKPQPDQLQDPEFAKINTILTLHVALYSLAEIANHDPVGKLNAQRMEDGTVAFAIAGEEGATLTLQIRSGQLRVKVGLDSPPRAKMVFADLQTAGAVLGGTMDSYTAIGRGGLRLGGYVPLLDNMNKILGLVPNYLLD